MKGCYETSTQTASGATMTFHSTINLARRAKTTMSLTASAAVVIAGAGLAVSTSSPAAAATAPPGDCFLNFLGVNSAGAIVKRQYTNGSLSAHTYNPGRLGFVPRGMVGTGTGGMDFIGEGYLANRSDGNLYGVGVNAKTSYNDVVITKTSVNKTWGSIRSLTWGSALPNGNGLLYGLSDSNGFYRYQTSDTAPAPHTRATIGSSGWALNTIAYDRSGYVPGTSRKADIFVATSTGGQLIEYTVPLDKPSEWSRKTLKAATWGNFKALKTGNCYSTTTGKKSGRILIGVHINGDAYLYFDKNATDGSGADITGYGKLSTGWLEKIYS